MTADTIPNRLLQRTSSHPRKPAFFTREGGAWNPTSWGEYADQVTRAGTQGEHDDKYVRESKSRHHKAIFTRVSRYRGFVATMNPMMDVAPTSGWTTSTKPARRISASSVLLSKIFTIGAFPRRCITHKIGLTGSHDSPRHIVDETKKPPGLSKRKIRSSGGVPVLEQMQEVVRADAIEALVLERREGVVIGTGVECHVFDLLRFRPALGDADHLAREVESVDLSSAWGLYCK